MKGIIALKQVNTTVPTELQGRYSIVTMATKAQRSLSLEVTAVRLGCQEISTVKEGKRGLQGIYHAPG